MNTKFTKGIAAMSAVALLAGGAVAVSASSLTAEGNGQARAARNGFHKLFMGSDPESREALGVRPGGANLSAEEKADWQAQREVRREAAVKKQAEMKAALEAGDYEKWRAIVGADSAIAQKITVDNFALFVQAHELRAQSDLILKDLGLEAKGQAGFHLGLGLGLGPK